MVFDLTCKVKRLEPNVVPNWILFWSFVGPGISVHSQAAICVTGSAALEETAVSSGLFDDSKDRNEDAFCFRPRRLLRDPSFLSSRPFSSPGPDKLWVSPSTTPPPMVQIAALTLGS